MKNLIWNVKLLCLILILLLTSIPCSVKDNLIKLSDEPNYVKIEVRNGLTIDEAIDISLQNNLEVKSKKAEVDLAEAAIKQPPLDQILFLRQVNLDQKILILIA